MVGRRCHAAVACPPAADLLARILTGANPRVIFRGHATIAASKWIAKRRAGSFTLRVSFSWNPFRPSPTEIGLTVNGQPISIALVRNARARRYVLRLRPDGSARITIPRGGSASEAQRFGERHVAWLENQLSRHAARSQRPTQWLLGTEILFRGELVKLAADVNGRSGWVQFGTETIKADQAEMDWRVAIEKHLWRLATREFPPLVLELAARHQLTVNRVTVRSQRSRWGSCSRRGTISLNWRLIQTPAFVRDYIVLHELMHLRQMNHSARYWREVEQVCPDYATAERWLKQHSALLR